METERAASRYAGLDYCAGYVKNRFDLLFLDGKLQLVYNEQSVGIVHVPYVLIFSCTDKIKTDKYNLILTLLDCIN